MIDVQLNKIQNKQFTVGIIGFGVRGFTINVDLP